MKKLLSITTLLMVYIICSSFGSETGSLSKDDRKEIISYLKETKKDLIGKVKGLSTEQWNYKPTPETWSAAEICEHIYKAEAVVLKRVVVEGKEYKPELIAENEAKKVEMIAFIVGRETKLNAPEPVAPVGLFNSPDTFIKDFENKRKETSRFVTLIDEPIKAYYEKFGPIGEVNGYHWLMFISAHTIRHMKQLDEVLTNPDFPS